MKIEMFAWSLVIIASVCNALGVVFVKYATISNPQGDNLDIFFSQWFIIGILFSFTNFIVLAIALRILPLSMAYPVLIGFAFFVATLCGSWFFGENINRTMFFGLLMIVMGIYLVSRTQQ